MTPQPSRGPSYTQRAENNVSHSSRGHTCSPLGRRPGVGAAPRTRGEHTFQMRKLNAGEGRVTGATFVIKNQGEVCISGHQL